MNNLEQLERLGKLKEKGLISEEDFLAQKKKLLESEVKGVNWGNIFLSFLISLAVTLVYLFLSAVFSYLDILASDSRYIVLTFILACIFALIAKKLETYKYKNGSPFWGVFIGTMVLPSVAVWVFSYQFLQIKQKKAILK